MAAKVEWVRGWRGTKIVTLPDESKLTSMMLAKELKLTKHTAIARINAYIDNGSLVDLWRAKNKKMDINNRVVESIENLDTHYEEGDLRQIYDPMWKLVMQNI
jgi:hypothetical protein|tara:strand:- start:168 stop:476 length:309 start_codon:yes stop_codon:yes gene_type:complete